jgi:hypothetical protein
MKLVAGILVLLCAALGAAGCGDGDKNDFINDYNDIVRKYRSLPGEVGSAISGASNQTDARLEKQFSDLATRTRNEADELAQLDPPDDAKDEYDAYVAGLREVARHLDDVAEAAKAHSTSKARKAAESLVDDAQELTREEDALKKAVE